MKTVIAALLLCASGAAFANSACDKPKSDFDGLYCLNKVYQEADKELNTNYQALSPKLDAEGKQATGVCLDLSGETFPGNVAIDTVLLALQGRTVGEGAGLVGTAREQDGQRLVAGSPHADRPGRQRRAGQPAWREAGVGSLRGIGADHFSASRARLVSSTDWRSMSVVRESATMLSS